MAGNIILAIVVLVGVLVGVGVIKLLLARRRKKVFLKKIKEEDGYSEKLFFSWSEQNIRNDGESSEDYRDRFLDELLSQEDVGSYASNLIDRYDVTMKSYLENEDSINMDFSKDPDKYLKFEKFKESVKSLLDSKEHIWISVIPYKYDTIEKEITEGDNLWEGIKYSGSWDVIVKRATFHFDIESESINDFYNIIKKYKSLDELKGDDFNLVPLENDGGHRENIKIDWERPLTEKELKAFEEYGGKEELASVSERQTDDILVGRISAIEISVGKERNDYGQVIGKKEIIKIEID